MTFCRLWEWASSTVTQLSVSSRGVCAGEDFDFSSEVLAGDGRWIVHYLLGGAVGDEVAAVFSGARAEVEDVVGFADGVFVVLDDEDGVAEVAEVFEGVDEALVVALVEADGGLVEDVEDAAEAGADLRCEADALAFAAGESGGGAVEGEVAEADGVEEFEAFDDLALEAVRDDAVAASEVHLLGCGESALEWQRSEVGDARAVHGDGEGFGAEAAAFADGAEARGHVLHHVLAVALGLGVFEVGAEVVEDAVEAGAAGLVSGRAVEEEVLLLGGEVFEGLLDVDLVFFGEQLDEAEEVGGAAAGAHGAVEERLGPVGDGLGGVEVVDAAEAVAVGASAVVGVEGEAAGFETGDVDAAVGAGHGGGVEGFVHAVDGDEDEAVGHLQSLEDAGLEAAGVVLGRGISQGCISVVGGQRLEDDAIDYCFDGVVLALFEAHALGEFDHLAIDAGAEALLVEGFELFAELAFAAADDGGVDGDAFAGREAGDSLDDLLGSLAGDGAVAVGAMGLAYAGVEEAEVVIDLSDGAHCGAGAAAGGFLFDGDGGGEAIDGVDVGTLHLV